MRRRKTDTNVSACASSSDDPNGDNNSSNYDDPKDEDYLPSPGSVRSSDNEAASEKEARKTTPANYTIQCASYAAEMLSRGYIVTHRFGFLITDRLIEMQYYDHSIILTTNEVNFIDNPQCWKLRG